MLKTKDLYLDKARIECWEDMYRNLWRHPESARYMMWEVTASPADARARMLRTIRFQAGHPGTFLVYERQSGQAIGFAGLRKIDERTYGEAGIAIGPAFTRRGYGRQALAALVDYAFGAGGAERFEYCCLSANQASKALAASLGFQRVGQGLVYYEKDRVEHPQDIYELTKETYQKR